MTRIVLAVLFSALGLAWAAEENSPKEEDTTLHNELRKRNYDHALKAMTIAEDINAIDPNTGHTALSIAATDESADAYDMVKALVVMYGADLGTRDGRGFTPLHHASAAGTLAVVELLLENGAEVNAVNELINKKMTPLYMAVWFNRPRVAAMLRLNGAEELDEETANALRMDAAIQRARRAAYDQMDENFPDSPEDALQIMYDHISRAVIAEYEALGQLEEAARWRNFGADRMAEIISQYPPSEDGDPQEWLARITQRVMSELQGGNQETGASGEAP